MKEWKNKQKGKLEILLHVENKQAYAIRKLTAATEVWSKLKLQMFEPHDGITRIHTLATLFHMCVFHEEEDGLTFLDTWETYLEEAATTGNGVLLSKLSESWKTFITMNS